MNLFFLFFNVDFILKIFVFIHKFQLQTRNENLNKNVLPVAFLSLPVAQILFRRHRTPFKMMWVRRKESGWMTRMIRVLGAYCHLVHKHDITNPEYQLEKFTIDDF